MKKSPLTIGFLGSSYPYKRNIIGISSQVRYKQIFGFNAFFSLWLFFLQKLHLRFSWYKIRRFFYLFVDLNLNHKLRQIDILHFFNTINQGTTPWIATFEGTLPIYHVVDDPKIIKITDATKVEKALRHLCAPSCLQLIALSHYTEHLQQTLLNQFPEFESEIASKIKVCYPPQKLLISSLSEKKLPSDELSFLFVGRHFWRKGGYEVIKAFDRFIKSGKSPVKIKLTLIGDIAVTSGINVGQTLERQHEVETIIAQNNWIEHLSTLSNPELLQKMKETHVGLLPTYADTFGYSVLEMQACGCPVISTNVQALPEINSDKCGWLIHLPKTSLGHALYQTASEQSLLSATIQQQLEEILYSIVAHPEIIAQKAQNALIQLAEQHSPEKYAEQLEMIYHHVR